MRVLEFGGTGTYLYKNISLVPVIAKIVEAAIKNQISSYFESHQLLASTQFGFRPGMSTVDAVSDLVDSIIEGYEVLTCYCEKGELSQALMCDLSKAFDCVDHGVLLQKLEQYGVTGTELKLFESYLNNRYQQICVNGSLSDAAQVLYGVP
ncbi:uncharacterized protein LOC124358388 [Homalodisca vitripennis]|uniref:uncharacterized protein LOC124358388 n=1 Tax=Homalodisca vitripennis TaxID=197043 RepID=UPI001EEA3D69|nr:uncharacterized protein LOC124358388 [Homalodisca vitripennis]